LPKIEQLGQKETNTFFASTHWMCYICSNITIFFFFFFVTNISIETGKTYSSQGGKKTAGGAKPLQREGGKKGGSGNAARVNSCRSPISHMMGAEVGTSVYLLCCPLGGRGKKNKGVFDDFFNKPVLSDGWVL
jgi:hypothetical protein